MAQVARLNVSELASRLNSSYWFVPLVVTAAGTALGLVLLVLDARVALDPDGPLAVIRPSSAEGARDLLSAVIGAMITAISVTFSVSIVALTVAAQHFGPRVLNNFVRQTSAQVVLGTFMATFVYAVLVLGSIRGTGPDTDVPELAVSGAVVLVILSIGALIYYVHHVSTTLQIGELAASIVADMRHSMPHPPIDIESLPAESASEVPEAPADATVVPSVESGYVQRVDFDAVVAAARVHDVVVWIRREPGSFVLAGTPLAMVHPAASCTSDLARTIQGACVIGPDRTFWHDPEFAVKQLVEIALRALSPAVNEPFTAITCIDRLAQGLATAAASAAPPGAWLDSDGRVRAYAQPQPFPTLLRASFDPIRIFAGPNPAIYARLLENLADIGLVAIRDVDHRLVCEQVELVHRAAGRAVAEPEDRAFVQSRYELAVRQLAGRPTSNRR